MDLLDVFRGLITPRKVLVYIDHLPSWSAFAEASAQDDELVDMVDDDAVDQTGPRVRDWSPERDELVNILDAIRVLTALVAEAAGGRVDQPQPQPRPQTAWHRRAVRQQDAAYEGILDALEQARVEASSLLDGD